MLDKGHQNNIDKAFINASWKKMNVVLDEQLPESRKDDRALIYLLSSLLIFTLFALGFISYKYLNFIPNTALTKEKIIYQKVYEDAFNQDAYTQIISNKIPDSRIESSQDFISSELSFSNLEEFIPETNFQNSLETQYIGIDQVPTLKFSLDSESNRPVEMNTESIYLEDQQEITKTKKLSKIDMTIGLLTFVSNNQDFSGYGFSSGIQVPISKKVGLNTGVAVNFVSRGYTLFPFLDRSNPSNDFGKTKLNEEDTYYAGLKSFKQVYFPIGINYNVTKFLTLNSGLKFRYTFTEDIDRVLEVQARQRVNKNESVANTFFNQTNVGLSAGFTVAVSDKLSFYVDSEWGLSSLTNSKVLSNPTSRRYDLNLINLSTNYKF